MSDCSYLPLGARVLLKPLEVEEKTSGGIFLPDSAVERENAMVQDAEIVAMGALAFMHEVGAKLEVMPDKPKIGDKVRIIKYVGDVFTIDGEKYRLVNDCDVLAVKQNSK